MQYKVMRAVIRLLDCSDRFIVLLCSWYVLTFFLSVAIGCYVVLSGFKMLLCYY